MFSLKFFATDKQFILRECNRLNDRNACLADLISVKAMKCNRTLLISIILLGSAMNQNSTGATPAASAAHSTALPNFVKHNQGVEPSTASGTQTASKAVVAGVPTISVQLQSNPDKTITIGYIITDCSGKSAGARSKYSSDSDSDYNKTDIFSTTFPANGDVMVMSVDGEIIIAGRGTDSKWHAWKSDSKIYCDSDMDDCDVRWTPVNCF